METWITLLIPAFLAVVLVRLMLLPVNSPENWPSIPAAAFYACGC